MNLTYLVGDIGDLAAVIGWTQAVMTALEVVDDETRLRMIEAVEDKYAEVARLRRWEGVRRCASMRRSWINSRRSGQRSQRRFTIRSRDSQSCTGGATTKPYAF